MTASFGTLAGSCRGRCSGPPHPQSQARSCAFVIVAILCEPTHIPANRFRADCPQRRYGTGMKAMTSADPTICLFCGTGSVVERNEEIAFRQWSDKGYIHSRVAIPIAVCDQCDA